MKNKQIIIAIYFLFACSISQAQISNFFTDVKFDESLSMTKAKVEKISKSIKILKVASPIFPLAKKKEEHLIASKVKFNNEIIDSVVFTFSDDKLSFIQAKGITHKSIASIAKSKVKSYLNFKVYESDLIFIDEEKNVAWFLTSDSVHPNLFTWNNPYLFDSKMNEVTYKQSVKVPNFIKMGVSIDSLTPKLKENSNFIDIQTLKKNKTQINCYGIEYAGFPRKFEARFENKILNMVWILTGKGEEDRIRGKLIKEYGKALYVNKEWEVFNNWTVLLRKDKPEILLLSKELGLIYKKKYSQE